MSIAFASPLLLLGLAVGMIPILIHRLTHQKTVKRPFSAVRLLVRSQKTVARPQRLKHFLLLALRVTAVMLPLLAAAQPTLVRPGLLAFGPGGAKAIIVDNSMSMGYEDDGGARVRQACAAARAIIDRLSDRVAVIPTVASNEGAAAGGQGALRPPREAADLLSSLTLSPGRGDPGAALARAFDALRLVEGRKEIVVISDMAKGDWQGFDPARLGVVPADGRISFLRIGGAGRDSNAAIKDVTSGSEGVFAGTPFPLEVTVSNLSDKEGQVVVSALLDGTKVDQRSLRLKAGEERKAAFELVAHKPGWMNGEARLSPDNLAADNSYYFSLFAREKGRIVIVDGDPRAAIRESESYYLTRALLPNDSNGSPFRIQVIHERDLWEKDLSECDALFLLNVRQPPPARLASLLQAGKSVFIFLGDRVLPEEYNGMPLFPWRLRGLREFGEKQERISRMDLGSDVLAQFRESGAAAVLSGASFSRSWRVEGATKPLLALGNGDPLLVESPRGKGRLYLFASTADLDWNDLPLSAAYVPLMQGLVKTALRAAQAPTIASSVLPGIRVGEAFEEKAAPEQITGVRGGPGVYRFSLPTGEVRRPVNVPLEESDLTKMTKQDLERFFPGVAIDVTEYRADGGDAVWGSRRDLWPYVLGLVLLVLGVEMGVALRT